LGQVESKGKTTPSVQISWEEDRKEFSNLMSITTTDGKTKQRDTPRRSRRNGSRPFNKNHVMHQNRAEEMRMPQTETEIIAKLGKESRGKDVGRNTEDLSRGRKKKEKRQVTADPNASA